MFGIPMPGEVMRFTADAKNLPLLRELNVLLDRFNVVLTRKMMEPGINAWIVRPSRPLNMVYILDRENLWFLGEEAHGMPCTRGVSFGNDEPKTRERMALVGQRELGLVDPFVVQIPLSLLTDLADDPATVDAKLEGIAAQLIVDEYRRHRNSLAQFHFSPLFGPPSPILKPNQCFVIGPFNAARTIIYNTVIKPTVEANGCSCQRVDETHENRAITQTIWHSLCEAHFVIADLTEGNANVFYELGIAHTLGKEVILIEEESTQEPRKRMFDTYSLAAILYKPDVQGGFALRDQLDARIKKTLERVIIPSSL
jgi:hypothetical protein